MKRIPATLIAVGLLIVIAIIGYLLVPHLQRPDADMDSDSGGTIADGPSLELPAGTEIPGGALQQVPEAETMAFMEDLAAARKRLEARQDGDETGGIVPMPKDTRNPELIPKHVPLLEEQKLAFAKLQMRSGKNVQYLATPFHHSLRYLEGMRLHPSENGDPLLTALTFLSTNKELLRIKDPETELVRNKMNTDELGYTQIRFDQQYKDLPVWPSSIMVQTEPSGDVVLMTGSYIPTPDHVDTTPGISMEEATSIAISEVHSATDGSPATAELIIYAMTDEPARLAYTVLVNARILDQWRVVLDAQSGAVLAAYKTTRSNGVQGSSPDGLGVVRDLNLWSEDGFFYTIDTSKGMFDPETGNGAIVTFDCGGFENVDEAIANEGIEIAVSSSPTAGFSPACVSLAYHLSNFYDFLSDRHSRNSLDGEGMTIEGYTNLSFENAYCSGDGKYVVFGRTSDLPLAALVDVVGHEAGHAVNHSVAGLVYQYQTGAIDEALADMFGESLQQFETGSVDYLAGGYLQVPIRSLSDPNTIPALDNRPHPAKMSEFFNLQLDTDNGGVHINSTIISHALYLLAEDIPGGGIGFPDAEKIFYRAISKLNGNSQFIDMRLACVQSAEELFGNGSQPAQKTAAAFDAVEVYAQSGTPDPVHIPATQGDDNLLFTFTFWGYETYLGRREYGLGDTADGVKYETDPIAFGKVPSVTGDGSLALIVTADYDLALLDTMTGAYEKMGYSGSVYSAAISADGNVASFVFIDELMNPENRISVYWFDTGEVAEFELREAIRDGGGETLDTIVFADRIDLTPDGSAVLYDALNRISYANGTYYEVWSIYMLDIESGVIMNIVPPIQNFHLGNPALGQTANHLITFEIQDDIEGMRYVVVMNLVTGEYQFIAQTDIAAGLMYPGFSGDDQAIAYTEYYFDSFVYWDWIPLIAARNLNSDYITPNGDSFDVYNPTYETVFNCVVYRRGDYSELPMVGVIADAPQLTESSQGIPFIIYRNEGADKSYSLPVSFVLSGSATNGADYQQVNLTTEIPANYEGVYVNIIPIDDAENETDEQVTLSLSAASHYRLSESGSATIELLDDDDSQATLVISVASLHFGWNAATRSVSIQSNTQWSISSGSSWCSVDPSSGSGNRQVVLTVSENPGQSARGDTLTISGGGLTRSVSVIQNNDLWRGLSDHGNGWIVSPWMGPLAKLDAFWIYHPEHAFLFCHGDLNTGNLSGFYYFDQAIGSWFWSPLAYYPVIYKFGQQAGWYWYYPGGSPGNRQFNRLSDKQIIHENAL